MYTADWGLATAFTEAMRGFVGPKDIFRNPEALGRGHSPVEDGCGFKRGCIHSYVYDQNAGSVLDLYGHMYHMCVFMTIHCY